MCEISELMQTTDIELRAITPFLGEVAEILLFRFLFNFGVYFYIMICFNELINIQVFQQFLKNFERFSLYDVFSKKIERGNESFLDDFK